MNEAKQKLLEEHKIIILPEDIDHDLYMFIVEAAVMYPNDEIVLYCRGDGGSVWDAFAIIDLIKRHGYFVGLLPGMAYSSHADIWISCQKRFVFPYGAIGLHRSKFNQSDSYENAHYHRMRAQEGDEIDTIIAGLLANISTETEKYWLDIMDIAGHATNWLYASELIGMGMARPISEYNPNLLSGVRIKVNKSAPLHLSSSEAE